MASTSSYIPLLLVSGFLGSGKTTLIRRLLLDPQMGEVAVIVNEFGEVGLDHYLVRKTDERTMLLNSGCICCSMRGDLSEALRDLLSKRERGQIPRFQRVVVETTGLADPVPILHTVVGDPVVRHHFQIERVVTTVDAVNGKANLASYAEAVRQVATADYLVVTKQDLVPETVVDELKTQLRNINPAASIIGGSFGDVDFDMLLSSDLPQADANEMNWSVTIQRQSGENGQANKLIDQPSEHSLEGQVSSRCIMLDRPLNWQVFAIWLTMLLHRHGSRVLRLKGLLNVGEGRGPLVLQGVQHVMHAPRHLKEWPDDDRRSRIVIIVRDLDPQDVEDSLKAFQNVAESM
jgi:G3E family GTPase